VHLTIERISFDDVPGLIASERHRREVAHRPRWRGRCF
jgi:hypothetical protein